MKRNHWGSFEDDSDRKKEVTADQIILPMSKMEKFQQIKLPYAICTENKVPVKNALVTQTIEVMNQTEMIQTLLDTYSNKSGYNFVINPCQMPTIDFPSSNAADLTKSDRMIKPFWFVPPLDSKFRKGTPKDYPKITKPVVIEGIKKTVCGLLRLTGFSEINESALIMFSDGVDQYMRLLTETMRDILINESTETENQLDIMTVEKGYYQATSKSVTSLHNYYKDEIVNRNMNEIKEFKDIFQEYDKLLQENHFSAQKVNDIKEEDFSFLDPGQSQTGNTPEGTITSFLEGEGVGFKDLLDGDMDNSTNEGDQMGQIMSQESYTEDN